uniref:Retrovirus-related Pol polyprotein from transposon TNT 1-94 n=1 Tax=Tanacetum cinerariifolium TaxID=118510 RepID=A0A699H7A6_TANCI|nr:retrovirus-related Pol polyprotein from transposon TNT 1-94 [Tanacetum cinerariifolium]
MIPDLDGVVILNGNVKEVLEPFSKMTEGNKKQYIEDVKAMNYLFQAIPNDIYNPVDACKNAKEICERIKRLMFVSINTKFLSCLQPEWSKYVTMVHHNQTGETVSYDMLYDSLVQFKPHVLAFKAKNPLALIAHSIVSSSQSHANSSYSPQTYYVTCPSSIVDYEDEYQGELQGDSQEDKLTTAMMMVVLQTKNTGYGGNGNNNVGKQSRNQVFNTRNGNDDSNQIMQRVLRTDSILGKANVQCYNCNERGYYARDCQKIRVCDANHFREQMLLAIKEEAGSNLANEENDFMLDTSYEEETTEDLTAAVISLMTISELKNMIKTVDKGKNVNNKFDKSETSGTLLCVTPLPKNIAIKVNKVSNSKVNPDRNASVKRALFTTPIAAKSKTLRATSVVAESRLSIAKTPTAKNKVSSVRSISPNSGQSRTLSNYMKNKFETSRKWKKWFEYQQSVNWIPKSKTAQSLPSETKSRLGHNLFLVRQFCDGDLEVAFHSNTCYVWNLQGDDLLTGSRDSNLYTIYISEIVASSLVCKMSRATSTKSWLWHCMLSHLNFGTINQLTLKGLVDGLPKFKYNKYHLSSACEQGKSKRASLPQN